MPCISKKILPGELESSDSTFASQITNNVFEIAIQQLSLINDYVDDVTINIIIDNELEIITHKLRFINDYVNCKINTIGLSKSEITTKLKEFGYPKLLETDIVINSINEELLFDPPIRVTKSYDYILKLPLSDMSYDTIKKLLNQMENILNILSSYNENRLPSP